MLFKDYHLPMIRSESKTVTRREWADGYARPNVGSVQIASDEMFTSDEEADCYIRILDVYDQPLGEMDDEDARAEGDYDSLAGFRDGYEKVYGDGSWDPEKVVTVVEFEYVGRERPRENERLVTDGGTSGNGKKREMTCECPRCGSTDIYNERGHGDTICHDCGWYTEEGSPSEAVDWEEIHERGGR